MNLNCFNLKMKPEDEHLSLYGGKETKSSLSSFIQLQFGQVSFKTWEKVTCSHSVYGNLSLLVSFSVTLSHCNSTGADGVEPWQGFEGSCPSSPWLSQDLKPDGT